MEEYPNQRVAGFTLVEIVIAIGLLTFALVGVVMLMGNALRSSTDTQRDSALASALMTSSAVLRGAATNLTATNLYFDQQGSLLANTNRSYYAVALQSVGSGTGPTNLDYWTVKITAPFPATNAAGAFLLSRVKP